MTEPSKERRALQRGAAIHLRDALSKAEQYRQAGEKLQSARTETQGWLYGVDEAMLSFSQFQLRLEEVRDIGVGDWSDTAWQLVTDRLGVVSRSTYGKETPEQARKRQMRNELLALPETELRRRLDVRIKSMGEQLWNKGSAAVAEFLTS